MTLDLNICFAVLPVTITQPEKMKFSAHILSVCLGPEVAGARAAVAHGVKRRVPSWP